MAQKVLVLLGTKKGAFILESDATRRSLALRGPFCETWPMNHVVADPATGTIYGGGGNEWFGPAVWKSDRSRRDLDPFERRARLRRPARRRSSRSGASRRTADRLYAGVEPAGLFRSDDGGESWQHVAGLRNHPVAAALAAGRRRADPAFAGAASRRPNADLGRHLGGRRVPHAPMAARPGSRATAAPAPTSCPRASAIRSSASACTAWSWRPACRTGSTSRTIAACTAATTAASSWESIEEGLPSSFGFPAAAHPRDPDTALPAAAQRRHRRPLRAGRAGPRSGGRATAARPGRPARGPAAARTPISACCARRWRPTGWSRPGVYFGTSTRHALRQRRRGRQLDLHRAAPADDLFGRDAGRSPVEWHRWWSFFRPPWPTSSRTANGGWK